MTVSLSLRAPLGRSLGRSPGFNIEAAAALAYDLAGVSYRGTDALLNGRWSLVEKELQCRHTITREDVIQKLRTQSKHMNKINVKGPVMTRTDLLISQCMNPNQEHLGLYRTADDAARAYDRALIERLGGVGIELDRCACAPTLTRSFARSRVRQVLASSFINFPLYEYGDMLSEEERQAAVALNVVPDDEGIEPTCPPVKIYDLNSAGPGDEVPFEDARSVLDILANAAETEGDEVGVKRESVMEAQERGTVRRSKRSRKVVASLCEEDPTGDDL